MSCEQNETPKVNEELNIPVDTGKSTKSVDVFAANRRFERFLFFGEGRPAKTAEIHELSEDEMIATIIYDNKNQRVKVVYCGDKTSPIETTS